MGDFNHIHIQWKSLESTGGEDQQFLFLIQYSFLTQHVLEPTRGGNVLDIVLSSQKGNFSLAIRPMAQMARDSASLALTLGKLHLVIVCDFALSLASAFMVKNIKIKL